MNFNFFILMIIKNLWNDWKNSFSLFFMFFIKIILFWLIHVKEFMNFFYFNTFQTFLIELILIKKFYHFLTFFELSFYFDFFQTFLIKKFRENYFCFNVFDLFQKLKNKNNSYLNFLIKNVWKNQNKKKFKKMLKILSNSQKMK